MEAGKRLNARLLRKKVQYIEHVLFRLAMHLGDARTRKWVKACHSLSRELICLVLLQTSRVPET